VGKLTGVFCFWLTCAQAEQGFFLTIQQSDDLKRQPKLPGDHPPLREVEVRRFHWFGQLAAEHGNTQQSRQK